MLPHSKPVGAEAGRVKAGVESALPVAPDRGLLRTNLALVEPLPH